MSQFPDFTKQANCSGDKNPDAWFPDDVENSDGKIVEDSYTKEGLRARFLCDSCPAFEECREYSLRFRDLPGIWAGMDLLERKRAQYELGLRQHDLPYSYNYKEILTLLTPRREEVDEWI